MAAPLCTPVEVAQQQGLDPYQGVELTQVTRLCAQVAGLIRTELPQIDVWLAAGQVDPDVVSGVACQVVARVKECIANGNGVLKSEQHPEYAYQLTAQAALGLELTDRELALLRPPVIESGAAAFTIRPGGCAPARPADTCDHTWRPFWAPTY